MADHGLDHELLALIEIPKGSRNKYEYDEGIGEVILDRFLSSSTVYPTDYGYLMGHRGRDGRISSRSTSSSTTSRSRSTAGTSARTRSK